MLCLFLDMSFDQGYIAVFKDGIPCISVRRDILEMKSALYHIQTLLDCQNLSIASFDFFAVGTGPGSYTGLRNAASIVKGMSYAMKKPIVEVPSLLAQIPDQFQQEKKCIVIFDAKIGGFYAQSFERECIENKNLNISEPTLIAASVELLVEALEGVDSIYSSLTIEEAQAKDSTSALFPEWVRPKWKYLSKDGCNQQSKTDSFVAQYIFQQIVNHQLKGWDTLSLQYLRKTQAELERAASQKA